MALTPATLAKQDYQNIWVNPKSFATTLLVLCVDTYGTECFSWSPDTLLMEIQDDFQIMVPPANFDRLMAAINLVQSDGFFRSLPDFVMYCNILCGDAFDPRVWDPADAAEVAWGITEALLIAEPEEEEPFTDEILAYIGAVLDDEGIINAPDILRLGTRETVPARIHGEFSDDPEMFQAIAGFEHQKTQEINAVLVHGLRELSQQLDQLPLRGGDTRGVVGQMLQGLQGRPVQ